MPRHYTIQQANELLPELAKLIRQMQEEGRQLAILQGRNAALKQRMRGNGHHNPSEDALALQAGTQLEEGLREGVDRLEELELELKDLQQGLVDFPALRDGRTVFLCWQLGEAEVEFWHETTTGFSSRQPLDDKLR